MTELSADETLERAGPLNAIARHFDDVLKEAKEHFVSIWGVDPAAKGKEPGVSILQRDPLPETIPRRFSLPFFQDSALGIYQMVIDLGLVASPNVAQNHGRQSLRLAQRAHQNYFEFKIRKTRANQ